MQFHAGLNYLVGQCSLTHVQLRPRIFFVNAENTRKDVLLVGISPNVLSNSGSDKSTA
jgi:hypothetical protein